MPITIYFDHRPLIITDQITADSEAYLDLKNVRVIQKTEVPDIDATIKALEENTIAGAIILTEQVLDVFEAFKRKMKVIQAGGGLVYTYQKTALLIFRKKKWDLPKGKLDKGETIEQAALREVEEETGLKKLILGKFLLKTYHTYREKGKLVLKESHWYLMEADEAQTLTPQLEEDIERCEWVSLDSLEPYLKNAHASVIDVLKLGRKHLL